MAFLATLVTTTWTLIGNNTATITFQNIGSMPAYVTATATNSTPADSVGMLYNPGFGELRIAASDLTASGGQYIWAKTVSGTTLFSVE